MSEIVPGAVEGEIVEALTADERKRLDDCEKVIRRGLQSFAVVGAHLREINESRLYREDYGTFVKYLKGRWQISGSRGYELIGASAIADILPVQNEGQARALAGLPAEDAKKVYAKAAETKPQPTAKDLAAAREEVIPKAKPTPPEPKAEPPQQAKPKVTKGGNPAIMNNAMIASVRDHLHAALNDLAHIDPEGLDAATRPALQYLIQKSTTITATLKEITP